MAKSEMEDPGLCAMCYLSWCKSPKTWCRFLCFMTTLTHGIIYAVLSCLLILDLQPSKYFPLLGVLKEKLFPDNDHPMLETYITCFLIIFNFLLALPYLIIAAGGTKAVCLLFFTFVVCTFELAFWLGVLIFAIISLSHVTTGLRIIFQWVIQGSMISLLFMCWTLLLMTWKKRRHEELLAIHTAKLISKRKRKRTRGQDTNIIEARV